VAAVDLKQDFLDETKKIAAAYSNKLSLHTVDISNRELVYALPEKVIAHHGQVDALITLPVSFNPL
jgi:hypothetical protein